ncbi:hypothetical protein ACH5RR_002878 [Cinchona calisaya]|uniref:Uncharacterized protein n=1 Tax=Cinchona calisaya TaxID=153742 RepID=A0ABD3ATV7_9GENT
MAVSTRETVNLVDSATFGKNRSSFTSSMFGSDSLEPTAANQPAAEGAVKVRSLPQSAGPKVIASTINTISTITPDQQSKIQSAYPIPQSVVFEFLG